jgi:hypothetical protein
MESREGRDVHVFEFHLLFRKREPPYTFKSYTRRPYTKVWVFLQVTLLPTAHTLALARVELCVAVRCGWTVEFFHLCCCFSLRPFSCRLQKTTTTTISSRRKGQQQEIKKWHHHFIQSYSSTSSAVKLSVSSKEVVYCWQKTAILRLCSAAAAAHVFIIQCRCILLCRLENFIRTTKKKTNASIEWQVTKKEKKNRNRPFTRN